MIAVEPGQRIPIEREWLSGLSVGEKDLLDEAFTIDWSGTGPVLELRRYRVGSVAVGGKTFSFSSSLPPQLLLRMVLYGQGSKIFDFVSREPVEVPTDGDPHPELAVLVSAMVTRLVIVGQIGD